MTRHGTNPPPPEGTRPPAPPGPPAIRPADLDRSQAAEDARQLRYHAASLTYNDTTAEGEAKHRLHEIAMRIETGYYSKALRDHREPLRCDGCGKTIAEHSKMLRCPPDARRVVRENSGDPVAAWREGRDAAAALLLKKRDDFCDEFGLVDPDTGALEFGRGARAEAQEQWVDDLQNLADEIRALYPPGAPAEGPSTPPAQNSGDATHDEMDDECDKPPFGWRCTRGAGHEGPCAAVEAPDDVESVKRGMDRYRAGATPPAQQPEIAQAYNQGRQFEHERQAAIHAQQPEVGVTGGMPMYGRVPWQALIDAVSEAKIGRPGLWSPEYENDIGHSLVSINMPVAWREHVEERLRNWRQSQMNRSGDRLALDDYMDAESLDDLIDYVCDYWSEPASRIPDEAALKRLQEKGAKAWAGVDPANLRSGAEPAAPPQAGGPSLTEPECRALWNEACNGWVAGEAHNPYLRYARLIESRVRGAGGVGEGER